MNDHAPTLTSAALPDPRSRAGRGPSCLSHALLDRVALGEAGAEEAATAHAHLTACAGCRATAALLDRDRATFLAESNLAGLAGDAIARASRADLGDIGWRTPAPARRSGWWRWLIAPVAFAAGALIIPGQMTELGREPGRTGASKGGQALTVYVLHAEKAAAAAAGNPQGTLHTGEPVHPGDRLRFELPRPTGEAPAYGIVLSRDGAGAISVYYPQGQHAALLPRAELPLPGAVELDETLGSENLIGLSCSQPIDVAMAVTAIKQAGAQQDLGLPCVETRYRLTKVPR